MVLTEQLTDLKKQLGREIPREILVEIGQFVQGVVQSGWLAPEIILAELEKI